MTGQPGTLTTRPLVWDAALQHLFVNENGTCTGARTSGEHDEIYLGFSR